MITATATTIYASTGYGRTTEVTIEPHGIFRRCQTAPAWKVAPQFVRDAAREIFDRITIDGADYPTSVRWEWAKAEAVGRWVFGDKYRSAFPYGVAYGD